ncbi:lytic murein transglycosylase B [Lysobacter soyae]|uniref:Lytic murein transglycosylase B n=1 Tax=Lysobacter soyae TaxID=2764185 RepID=A0ABX8WR98_9GAMM|nr:lytic murein transglycosylase B [Lysobacter sp. CJ11]QYR53348.1 lytic murein transglycosylase B [Lysobacter sp. CJ11]
MTRRLLLICAATLLASCATQKVPPPKPELPPAPPVVEPAPSAVTPTGPVPDLVAAKEAFALDTAAKYRVDANRVRSVLASAEIKDSIITAMSRPAEGTKQWRDYRPIFIVPSRIEGGKAFMTQNAALLSRAESRYGVPKEIITAITGVETGYGSNMGKYRVIDALYTLAFRYPRTNLPEKIARENAREAFFRDELAQVFALEGESHMDATQLKGSYAGAMGWGQFMPSSYRQYAVDGDNDGKRDLLTDLDDVIPSIANYFIGRGQWVPGRPVMVRANRRPDAQAFNPGNTVDQLYSQQALASMGWRPLQDVPADEPATIITFEGANGTEYWMAFRNFVAITKYNKSPMYAAAVYQLSQEIAGTPVPGA